MSPYVAQQQIAMTAPVIQKNEAKGTGQQIAMTAPVLEKTEGDRQMMAFLLPKVISLSLFSPLFFPAAQHPPSRRPIFCPLPVHVEFLRSSTSAQLLSVKCLSGVHAGECARADRQASTSRGG
jgi:hypothetical protein